MLLGIFIAFILTVVLWWMPILGPLLAGFIAGYIAKRGGVNGFIIGLLGGVIATIVIIAILYVVGTAFLGPLGFFIAMFLSFGITFVSIGVILLTAIGGAIGGLVSKKTSD